MDIPPPPPPPAYDSDGQIQKPNPLQPAPLQLQSVVLKKKQEPTIELQEPPPPPPAMNTASTPGETKTTKRWQLAESKDKEKWKYDPKLAKPADIDQLDWWKAQGFASSSQGSEGVFFIGWKDDSVVVVKGSSTVMADYYVSLIARAANFPFPKMRVARYSVDTEYGLISSRMTLMDELKKERDRGKATKMLLLPILTVMEYSAGKSFFDSHPTDLFGGIGDLSALGKKICFEIGKIMSFDVLINNWDRIPLVWNNEGNLGNILVSGDINRPITGIDNSISSIHPTNFKVKYDEYIKNVRELIRELTTSDKPGPYVHKVKTFLITNLGYDIGEEGCQQVRNGLLEGFKEIATKIDRPLLEKTYETIKGQIDYLIDRMAWGQDFQSLYGLVKINIDFLDGVLTEFKVVLNK